MLSAINNRRIGHANRYNTPSSQRTSPFPSGGPSESLGNNLKTVVSPPKELSPSPNHIHVNRNGSTQVNIIPKVLSPKSFDPPITKKEQKKLTKIKEDIVVYPSEPFNPTFIIRTNGNIEIIKGLIEKRTPPSTKSIISTPLPKIVEATPQNVIPPSTIEELTLRSVNVSSPSTIEELTPRSVNVSSPSTVEEILKEES